MVTIEGHRGTGTTMELSRRVAETSFDQIPREVTERAKELLLGLIAVALPGSRTFPGKTIGS